MLRQLAIKFGPTDLELQQRVRSAGVEEIERWAERVLSAQSLSEIFEG